MNNLQNAIIRIKEEHKDTIIVRTVLDRCIDMAGVLNEDFSDEKSQERLKRDLEKQLISINLSYLAVKDDEPNTIIKVDEEIKIKVTLLTKWIAKKYSDSLKPFGK